MQQKTLVLIKPDAMQRRLAGEIIHRFERVGLRITNIKQVRPTRELVASHYPVTSEWYKKVGNNTLSDCEKYEVDVVQAVGTSDPLEIGKLVHSWNIDQFVDTDVIAIVFEGPHAVEVVRKLCGPTLPLLAAPGTIRGDFSSASALSENIEKKPIRNLVHASGDPDEAAREIELWFGKE